MQHTPLDKLDKKHFAKGSRGSEQNGVAMAVQQTDNGKDIALMEAKVKKLCLLLEEVSDVHPLILCMEIGSVLFVSTCMRMARIFYVIFFPHSNCLTYAHMFCAHNQI